MGKLKAFMLDQGHEYRLLEPARKKLASPDAEFLSLALAPDNSSGLGFFAANRKKTDLIELTPNADYLFQWYNIDTGIWSDTMVLNTDGTGRLVLPGKPDTNGWAFRIKLRN
jgi:hypothetical protein